MNVVFTMIIGFLSWSVFEYFLHRFIGHSKKPLGMFSQEHRTHHKIKDYFAPPKYKVVFAIILLGLFILSGFPFFGFGWVLGYGFYEWTHYQLHVSAPKTRYGLWARRHHFSHHFHFPLSNYGVTSPVWDYVFRTHKKIDVVRVPKNYELRWIRDVGMHNPIFAMKEL